MKNTAEVCLSGRRRKASWERTWGRESDKQCKKRKEETEISSRLVNFALLMYKQLTSEQRYTISVLQQRKCTKKEIAHAIGVSNSTITRELRRNSSSRGVYKWDKAQRQAEKRKRQMPGNRSIKPFVREMAIGLLKQRQWSPRHHKWCSFWCCRIQHFLLYG